MADVQAFRFEDDGETPNNPRLPLVVYRAAVSLADAPDPAAPFERAFARHGWSNGWRNGIYPFLHFHTVTHEVLGIARQVEESAGGNARLVEQLSVASEDLREQGDSLKRSVHHFVFN